MDRRISGNAYKTIFVSPPQPKAKTPNLNIYDFGADNLNFSDSHFQIEYMVESAHVVTPAEWVFRML